MGRMGFAGWIAGATMAMAVAAGAQAGARGTLDEADSDIAHEEWRQQAGKGDTRAMISLGMAYHQGTGVPVDGRQAMEWYLKAADKGDPNGFNNAGVLYRDGVGVPRDLVLAYALFAYASDRARNDQEYDRAARNIEKTDVYVSKDQLDKARQLKPKDLAPEILRKHNATQGVGNPIVTDRMLPTHLLTALPDSYSLDPARCVKEYGTVKVMDVRDDSYTSMHGFTGYASAQVKDSTAVSNGVYTCAAGRFAIRVPGLSSGKVSLSRSAFGGNEYQVRFFEKGVLPGVARDPRAWEAAVVTTLLPEEWEGHEREVFAELEEMQGRWLTNLPARVCRTSYVSGEWGRTLQVVVFNRVASEQYPKTAARVAPLRDGLVTLGVNRLFHRNRVIVDLGLIVVRPEGLDEAAFLRYAFDQMDLFMSGFHLLPAES